MHQHVIALRMHQALMTQPVQQLVTVRRIQDAVQRIAAVQLANPF